jgi:ribonuclease HI
MMKFFGMEQKRRLLVIALMWQWWTARNKTNVGERSWSVDEVSFQARRWATEFTEFYAKQLQQQPNEDVERWRPPRESVRKINVDGAFKENPKSGGWGFVITGQNAEVLGSGAGCLMFPHSALHAEAEACIQGLTAAMNWRMTRMDVESDCQLLVQALNNQDFDRSHIGVLVRDARMLARLNFNSVSFGFCRRGCNKAAHAMAAMGVAGHAGNGLLWSDDVPYDVRGVVAADLGSPEV